MNDAIRKFEFRSTDVRVDVDEHGDPWWVLADVCEALGISNSRQVSNRLRGDEQARRQISTPGGPQAMTVVNEPGLYRTIFRSNKPEAEAFRYWVFHEALPEIRKQQQQRSILQAISEITSAYCQEGEGDNRELVYLITDGRYTKVGVSRNPYERLKSLQIGASRKLELVAKFPGGRRVEAKIHNSLKPKRVHGEWFDLCGVDFLRIVCEWTEIKASRKQSGQRRSA